MNTETTHGTNGAKPRNRAFDAGHTSLYLFDPEDLVVVGVDTKDASDHALWDRRALEPITDEYVENMIFLGVMQNILVAKRDGKPVVVFGRRRTLGARLANKIIRRDGDKPAFVEKYGHREVIQIKASVAPRGATDADLALMAAAENSARKEESLLNKAERVSRILALMPPKMLEPERYRRIAEGFAVSETAVRQWLAIASAAAPVRRAVESGRISASAALKIAGAGDAAAQSAALDELLDGEEKPSSAKATKVAGKRRAKKSEDGGPSAPKGPGRSKRALKKALKAIEDNALRMPAEHKEVADMVLMWAMGDDLDGEIWSEVQTDKLLRTLTGRGAE